MEGGREEGREGGGRDEEEEEGEGEGEGEGGGDEEEGEGKGEGEGEGERSSLRRPGGVATVPADLLKLDRKWEGQEL